ncbi:MAG: hypothetical protein U5L72_01965 [Bacteroidales bacterium]|nr:hypothetical protein [Bacteroidales bacterium]
MESSDQYNFSIFTPRNRHGRKNRNVIFTMLAIWAVAVFGFQILLRVIEKPVRKRLLHCLKQSGLMLPAETAIRQIIQTLLGSLLMARGKITVCCS